MSFADNRRHRDRGQAKRQGTRSHAAQGTLAEAPATRRAAGVTAASSLRSPARAGYRTAREFGDRARVPAAGEQALDFEPHFRHQRLRQCVRCEEAHPLALALLQRVRWDVERGYERVHEMLRAVAPAGTRPVPLEARRAPRQLFLDLPDEAVLRRLVRLDVAAERRPLAGVDDARLVVAVLQQQPA